MKGLLIKKMKVTKSSGQTSIEYVLMLLVAVTLIVSFVSKIKQAFLPDDNEDCDNNKLSFVCFFKRPFDSVNFRTYRLPIKK